MKKILFIMAVLIIIATTSILISAGGNTPIDTPVEQPISDAPVITKTVNNSAIDYKVIDSIPEGITPIRLDNQEELTRYVTDSEYRHQVMDKQLPEKKVCEPTVKYLDNLDGYPIGYRSAHVDNWFWADLVLSTAYKYKWDAKQRCNVYASCEYVVSSIHGATLGTVEWDEKKTSSSIYDNNKKLQVVATGVYTTYIIVKWGPFVIAHETQTYSATFSKP